MDNCNSCDNQNNSTNIPSYSKLLFAPLPENMLVGEAQTNLTKQRANRPQRRRNNRNQASKE